MQLCATALRSSIFDHQ